MDVEHSHRRLLLYHTNLHYDHDLEVPLTVSTTQCCESFIQVLHQQLNSPPVISRVAHEIKADTSVHQHHVTENTSFSITQVKDFRRCVFCFLGSTVGYSSWLVKKLELTGKSSKNLPV